MSAERSEKTDWRESYDIEFEEWVWALRDARALFANLRADLQPLDSDDYPLRAEAAQATKGKGSSL